MYIIDSTYIYVYIYVYTLMASEVMYTSIIYIYKQIYINRYLYPGIPTTIKTMGVNITTIAYLRVLIIKMGSTIILMVVEAQGIGRLFGGNLELGEDSNFVQT